MSTSNFTNTSSSDIVVVWGDGSKTLITAGGTGDIPYGIGYNIPGLVLTSSLVAQPYPVTSSELAAILNAPSGTGFYPVTTVVATTSDMILLDDIVGQRAIVTTGAESYVQVLSPGSNLTDWELITADTAAEIAYTPYLTIGSTTVQAAINEQQDEMVVERGRIDTNVTNIASTLLTAHDDGTIANAFLGLATIPTATNTVTIGTDVYEFLNPAGQVANDANIGVSIGLNVAASRTNLINAINGVGTGIADGILNNAGTGPVIVENGTESLVASPLSTTVYIKSADAVGGTAIAANPNIVVGETLTNVADYWNIDSSGIGGISLNTTGGRTANSNRKSMTSITVTANMITNAFTVYYPFTIKDYIVQIRSVGGIVRANGTDTFSLIGTTGIDCLPGGGVAPDIQVGDTITYLVWS